MKISSLAIDGFGIFRDVNLERLPDNLVLVLGDNEAGKSTLLGFLRSMLFGITRKGGGEPAYPPLRGGRHAGRLQVGLDSGESRLIERYVGGAGGGDRIFVTTPSGEVFDAAELARILDGTTRELYKNIYAFSLGELQTFESLRTEQVRGAISGAASGTALLAIPRAMDAMRRRMGELYDPAGSGALAATLRKLEGVRGALRQARGELAAHDALMQHLRQLDQELNQWIERGAKTRAELDRVKAFQRAWPDWIEIQRSETELEGQPTVENFPDNGLETLESEKAAIASLALQSGRLGEQRATLAREIEAILVDEKLLEQPGAIEPLFAESGRYGQARRAHQELARERATVEEGIGRVLESLGRGWTRERVQAHDRSLANREAIAGHQQALEDSRKELERAAGTLADRQAAEARAAQELKVAEEAAAPFQGIENAVDPASQEELKKRRAQFAAMIAELPLVERQQRDTSARLNEILREVNPRWSVDDLVRFNTSIAAHQQIESFESRLNEAEAAQAEAQSIWTAAGQHVEELQQRLAVAEGRLKGMARPRTESREEFLGRLQTARTLRIAVASLESAGRDAGHGKARLADKQQDLARLEALYSEPAKPEFPWIPTLLGFVALLAGGSLLGLKYLPAGARALATIREKTRLSDAAQAVLLNPYVGGGVALFGFILILWGIVAARRNRRRHAALAAEAESHRQAIVGMQEAVAGLREEQDRLNTNVSAAQAQVDHLLSELGVGSMPTARDLDILDERMQEALNAFDTWQQTQQEIAQLKAELGRAIENRTQAAEALAKGSNALAGVREQWKKHLAQIGLNPDLTPRMVFQAFSRVETGRRLAETVEDSTHRLAQMQRSREEYRALAGKIPELAAHLAGSDSELLTRVDAFFERERVAEQRRRQRDLTGAALAAARELARSARAELEQARSTHAAAQARAAQAARAWGEWLRANELEESLTPAAAQEIFRLMAAGLELIARSAGLGERIQALENEMRTYEGRAGEVFAALGRPAPEPDRLVAAVAALARELKEHQDRRLQRQEKTRQLGDIDQHLAALREDTAVRERRLGWLYASVAACDEADFRRRHEISRQREELGRRWLTILKVTGDTHEAALRGVLAATSDEALRQREQVLNQQAGDAEQEMERLRQRRAELAHQAETMRQNDRISRLRAEEETLLAAVREQALEWARNAAGLDLMQQARARFEREQQPGVIRQASGYFAGMTGGRYEGLMVPLGKETVEAVAADGLRKRPEELSRGTAEQLYLAIRFGYILHRATEHERMPLIMDEILVNFDAGRASLAAEIILNLAQGHQVFYFTCHRSTVEMFQSLKPDLAYFELRQGEFTYHEPPAVAVAAPEPGEWEGKAGEDAEAGPESFEITTGEAGWEAETEAEPPRQNEEPGDGNTTE